MEIIVEVVALMREQARLEMQLMNENGLNLVTEQDLFLTRRRLAQRPQAVRAVLETARALHRTPDAVSAEDVARWGSL